MSDMSHAAAHVIVHMPDNRLRRPLALWSSVARDVFRSRHLIREMLRRDLVSQYRQSVLGILLSLLPVLVTAAWAVLFQEARIINVGDVQMPYPFYVLVGLMIWSGFTEGMDAPMSGLLSEQGLISKTNVPAEAVVLARLGQVAINFGLKAAVIAVAAVIYGVAPSWTVLLAPVCFGLVVMLGASIGMILAPIGLLYNDVGRIVPIVTTFWFFLTPVIFTPPTNGLAAIIMREVNPVTPLLVTARDLAFRGFVSMPGELFGATVFTLILFVAAATFHNVALPIVIDRTNG